MVFNWFGDYIITHFSVSVNIIAYYFRAKPTFVTKRKGVGNMVSLFAAEVVKQLKLRKMTQKELAAAIGYNYSSLRSFLNDNYNNEGMAKAIANYLGIER